jgi:hypothetical protein
MCWTDEWNCGDEVVPGGGLFKRWSLLGTGFSTIMEPYDFSFSLDPAHNSFPEDDTSSSLFTDDDDSSGDD